MFDAQYERIKQLGQGSYGTAYLVRERSCPSVIRVAKEISVSHLTEKERQSTLAEAGVLSMMSHSNIVAYVATFCEGPKLHIVMEYADGGDLAKKIHERKERHRTFSEREIMFILVQLALALQHIHARNILHRDLKPLNIFLTKLGVVKLGDFGIAKVLGSTSAAAQTVIGTPHYLSPEICNNEPYGIQSDLWALGVVLYELAALRVPFHAHSLPVIAMKICSAEPAPLPNQFSTDLQKLVSDLLKKQPGERLSLDGMLRSFYVQGHIRALLLHSCECNSGGCEEIVAANGVSPLKEKNKPQDDVHAASGLADCPSTPKRFEVQTHVDLAAKEAVRQEFFRNRRAAMETKKRAQGVADVLNTQKENQSISPAHKESGSQQVAEVRRRSEEEKRQREAIRFAELERARQEMRRDVEKVNQLRRARESNGLFSGDDERTLLSPELNPTNKKMCVRCDENSPVTDKENYGSPAFGRELSESSKRRLELIKRSDEACFAPPWRMPSVPPLLEDAGGEQRATIDDSMATEPSPHLPLQPVQQMQICGLKLREGEVSSADAQTIHGYVADNEFSHTQYESMPTVAENTLDPQKDARFTENKDQVVVYRDTSVPDDAKNAVDALHQSAATDDELRTTKDSTMHDPSCAVKTLLSGTVFSDSEIAQLQVVLKNVLAGSGTLGFAQTGDVGAATLEYSTISAVEDLEPQAAPESPGVRLETTKLVPGISEVDPPTPSKLSGGGSVDNPLLNTNGSDFLTPDCTQQSLSTTKLIDELPVYESAPVDLTNQTLSADGQEAESGCPDPGEGAQQPAALQSPAGLRSTLEVQSPVGFQSPVLLTVDGTVRSDAPLPAATDTAILEAEEPRHTAEQLEQVEQPEPARCRQKKCCVLM